MVKRVSLSDAECPSARALDVIGDWWSLLIIRDAFDGVRRFSEFQKSLGIAKGVLTTRLHTLVQHGIFEQQPASDGSAYQEYVLTEKGQALFLVVVALRQWGESHLYASQEARSSLTDRKRGKPVAPLQLRSADGELLSWQDTLLKKVGK